MAIHSLLKECKFYKVLDATAAGKNDTLNSDVVDMQGFDSALVIAILGDVVNGATVTLKVASDTTAEMATPVYITGAEATATAAADADVDDRMLIVDVKHVLEKFIRADVVRGAAQNVEVDAVLIILYNSPIMPVTQDSAQVYDADFAIDA
jgi:hypothetical protein